MNQYWIENIGIHRRSVSGVSRIKILLLVSHSISYDAHGYISFRAYMLIVISLFTGSEAQEAKKNGRQGPAKPWEDEEFQKVC